MATPSHTPAEDPEVDAYIETLNKDVVWSDDPNVTMDDKFPGIPKHGAFIQAVIWKIFLIARNITAAFLNSAGEWMLERDPENDRGDKSTIADRKLSVETCGIIDGLRAGAWLVAVGTDTLVGVCKYTILHWATLNDGIRDAWKADPKGENKTLWRAIRKGFENCLVFAHNTPKIVKTWIKDLGNSMNGSATLTTFVEVMRSSLSVSITFLAQARANAFTCESVGQGEYERRKMICADAMFSPKRWFSHRQLEACITITRQMLASEVPKQILQGPYAFLFAGCDSVFVWFQNWTKEWVDFTKKSAEDHGPIFL